MQLGSKALGKNPWVWGYEKIIARSWKWNNPGGDFYWVRGRYMKRLNSRLECSLFFVATRAIVDHMWWNESWGRFTPHVMTWSQLNLKIQLGLYIMWIKTLSCFFYCFLSKPTKAGRTKRNWVGISVLFSDLLASLMGGWFCRSMVVRGIENLQTKGRIFCSLSLSFTKHALKYQGHAVKLPFHSYMNWLNFLTKITWEKSRSWIMRKSPCQHVSPILFFLLLVVQKVSFSYSVSYCWWFRSPKANHPLDVNQTLSRMGYLPY